MNLTLNRRPSLEHCTISELLVDGQAECFTIEDVVREVPGEAVSKWKVHGETAIPSGTYQVIVNHSERFGRDLPLLLNVPGFVGVRIHPGNTSKDTEGCILPGTQVIGESVIESRKAFNALFEKIQEAIQSGGLVHITVNNS